MNECSEPGDKTGLSYAIEDIICYSWLVVP
jgi:hypothetical protein